MIEDARQATAATQNGGLLAICATASGFLETTIERLGQTPGRIALVSPTAPATENAAAQIAHLAGLPGLSPGQGELIRYNLPGLTSLTPPAQALYTLFPGLRETARQTVDILDPTALAVVCEALPAPLSIVIDVPGGEAQTLAALVAAGVLERAGVLEIRCGVEPFFAGAKDLGWAQGWLMDQGFQREAQSQDGRRLGVVALCRRSFDAGP